MTFLLADTDCLPSGPARLRAAVLIRRSRAASPHTPVRLFLLPSGRAGTNFTASRRLFHGVIRGGDRPSFESAPTLLLSGARKEPSPRPERDDRPGSRSSACGRNPRPTPFNERTRRPGLPSRSGRRVLSTPSRGGLET